MTGQIIKTDDLDKIMGIVKGMFINVTKEVIFYEGHLVGTMYKITDGQYKGVMMKEDQIKLV